MPRAEMVILVRCIAFLTSLLPATNDVPRAHRHPLTQRLYRAGESLHCASRNRNNPHNHNHNIGFRVVGCTRNFAPGTTCFWPITRPPKASAGTATWPPFRPGQGYAVGLA